MFFLFVQVPTSRRRGGSTLDDGFISIRRACATDEPKEAEHPVHCGKNGVVAEDRDLSRPSAATRRLGREADAKSARIRLGACRFATNGNNLYAPIIAFTVTLGDNTFEFGKRQVHHASITGIHGLKGDDLAFLDRLAS